jgi:hypothetical protein
MPSGGEDNYNEGEEKIKSLFCHVVKQRKTGMTRLYRCPYSLPE